MLSKLVLWMSQHPRTISLVTVLLIAFVCFYQLSTVGDWTSIITALSGLLGVIFMYLPEDHQVKGAEDGPQPVADQLGDKDYSGFPRCSVCLRVFLEEEPDETEDGCRDEP